MTRNLPYSLILVILALLFFFPLLGKLHLFDWDEINFAESSREMLLTGNYFKVSVNFEPFWEKPPLFFWLQSFCMKLFGVNEFAARLPNAVFGIITMLSIYFIGKKHFSPRFGITWAILYFGSFLPHLYFKSGIIDPVFNYFIFVSIYFLFRSLIDEKYKSGYAIFAGLFNGMAVLTKGPVGLLLLLLTLIVFVLIKRFKKVPNFSQILIFAVTFVLTTSLWYGAEVIQNGPWFLVEFVKYQIELFMTPVAGHAQPFYYHFLVVFIGCFPISILALPVFFRNYDEDNPMQMQRWMLILFWVVMIVFSLSSTKIVHYSSMAYLPLSFLAALYVYQSSTRVPYQRTYVSVLFVFMGGLFAFLLSALPLVAINKDKLLPYLNDPFAAASFSNPAVTWSGYEYLFGVFYLVMVMAAFWFFYHRLMLRGAFVISIGTGLVLMMYLQWVVPKIENYSQGPAIDFFKEIAAEDAYVTTIGYKSYAHYFYAEVKPPKTEDGISIEKQRLLGEFGATSYNDLSQEEKARFNGAVNVWLMTGAIDKPVYFSSKITHKELDGMAGVELIRTEGGFKFFRRNP
jgi:4-amino-4-deoxy-L-arabinose transferase-like glycosyltransferase